MLKGYISVIAASLAYGIMPIISKLMLNMGMNAETVVFYRFLLTSIFTGLFLTLTKNWQTVTLPQIVQLIIFGIFGFGITAQLLTLSYVYIPVGMATVLHFAYPLIVVIIMIIIFKEKPTFFKIAACILAFTGIGFMVDFKGQISMTGILYALLSAVTYSMFVVSNKKAAFCTLNPMNNIFYLSCFAAMYMGAANIPAGFISFPSDLLMWGNLIIISLLCTFFAFYTLMLGIRILGAVKASVINMLEPATGVFLGIVIFSETLSFKIIIGAFLIFTATLLTVLDKPKEGD